MAELAQEIIPVNLEDEMRRSYLDYAMSVIVGRALPDVRDGLKPVHRRVLFAMNELGAHSNKPYFKRSEGHTSELQSLMRISYAVFCLKKKKSHKKQNIH